MGGIVVNRKRQPAPAGKHHPFQPGPHGLAMQNIAQEGPGITQGRAQGVLSVQDVFAPRGHHMQPKTWVIQHLAHARAVKGLQTLAKGIAHLLGAGALLSGRSCIVLVDVIVFQPLKGLHGLVQTGGGHAPGPNRRPHQIYGLLTLGQPLAPQKPIDGPQDQTLGTARSTRDDADVRRCQPLRLDVGQRAGASKNVQGFQNAAGGFISSNLATWQRPKPWPSQRGPGLGACIRHPCVGAGRGPRVQSGCQAGRLCARGLRRASCSG